MLTTMQTTHWTKGMSELTVYGEAREFARGCTSARTAWNQAAHAGWLVYFAGMLLPAGTLLPVVLELVQAMVDANAFADRAAAERVTQTVGWVVDGEDASDAIEAMTHLARTGTSQQNSAYDALAALVSLAIGGHDAKTAARLAADCVDHVAVVMESDAAERAGARANDDAAHAQREMAEVVRASVAWDAVGSAVTAFAAAA